jgi:hypothetical protein
LLKYDTNRETIYHIRLNTPVRYAEDINDSMTTRKPKNIVLCKPMFVVPKPKVLNHMAANREDREDPLGLNPVAVLL